MGNAECGVRNGVVGLESVFLVCESAIFDLLSAMRAVIQRVSNANVVIGGVIKGAISGGLLVLLAVEETDTAEDIEWLSGKIVRLRIFDDEQGVMNRSVQEAGGGILLISQFTLFASTRKGNRPSYSRSA